MNKETLIAVLLGGFLGILVAGFMVLKTRKGEQLKVVPITTSKITPRQSTIPLRDSIFEITEPEDNIITDTKSITIKGKSVKGTLLVIQSPVSLKTMKTDKEDFSVDFPLALGENNIHISSYEPDSKGAVREKQLKVFYLTEK